MNPYLNVTPWICDHPRLRFQSANIAIIYFHHSWANMEIALGFLFANFFRSKHVSAVFLWRFFRKPCCRPFSSLYSKCVFDLHTLYLRHSWGENNVVAMSLHILSPTWYILFQRIGWSIWWVIVKLVAFFQTISKNNLPLREKTEQTIISPLNSNTPPSTKKAPLIKKPSPLNTKVKRIPTSTKLFPRIISSKSRVNNTFIPPLI